MAAREFEAEMVGKRRAMGTGNLITLARGQVVRVTISEDGEMLELYSEQPLLIQQTALNVAIVKLRYLSEVE